MIDSYLAFSGLFHMNSGKGYVYDLCSCRKEAMDALLKAYPSIPGVFGRMTSFFTDFSHRLDGIEVGDEGLQYKLLLAVSFMRTHVCACEHIFNSESIESATLLRKQLELIARMKEVDVNQLSTLFGRVPNVRNVRPMNVLYGVLSKIAHNADVESLDMLGFRMEDEMHKHFCLYPVYNENTIFSFGIAIGLFLMFVVEAIHLQKGIIPGYDVQADGDAVIDFLQFGKSSNIPFFNKIEV